MDLNLYLLGIGVLIGFSVAAPIGPIGIYCIRQASAYGIIGGLVTGLGASIADGVYTAVAAYGAKFIEPWITKYMDWFEFLGGIFLLYVAYGILKAKIQLQQDSNPSKNTLWNAFWTTTVMTYLSPMTTLLFLAMFSKFGILSTNFTHLTILYLSLGVALGAMIWWVILSFIVSKITNLTNGFSISSLKRKKLTLFYRLLLLIFPELHVQDHLNLFLIINRTAATFIAFFGALMLMKGLGSIALF